MKKIASLALEDLTIFGWYDVAQGGMKWTGAGKEMVESFGCGMFMEERVKTYLIPPGSSNLGPKTVTFTSIIWNFERKSQTLFSKRDRWHLKGWNVCGPPPLWSFLPILCSVKKPSLIVQLVPLFSSLLVCGILYTNWIHKNSSSNVHQMIIK